MFYPRVQRCPKCGTGQSFILKQDHHQMSIGMRDVPKKKSAKIFYFCHLCLHTEHLPVDEYFFKPDEDGIYTKGEPSSVTTRYLLYLYRSGKDELKVYKRKQDVILEIAGLGENDKVGSIWDFGTCTGDTSKLKVVFLDGRLTLV